MKKNGFYIVRRKGNYQKEVAYFSGLYWYLCGDWIGGLSSDKEQSEVYRDRVKRILLPASSEQPKKCGGGKNSIENVCIISKLHKFILKLLILCVILRIENKLFE